MDPYFSKFVEAAREIRTSGRWENLNGEIRKLAADPGPDNAWFVQLFAALAFHAFSEYIALERDYEESRADCASLLAWRARNLLELAVWSRYCTSDRRNARRIYEDAGRDGLGIVAAFSKWGTGTAQPQEWHGIQAAAERTLRDDAAAEGILSLDGPYKQVADAAKECGLGDHFRVSYKLLSKFAHPTAMRLIAQPDARKEALQRDVFFSKGCLFFVGAFEALAGHALASQS